MQMQNQINNCITKMKKKTNQKTNNKPTKNLKHVAAEHYRYKSSQCQTRFPKHITSYFPWLQLGKD